MLLLVIILIIIVILFFNNNQPKSEGFENNHVSFYRLPNNQPLEDDTLFRNTVMYNNDDNPYLPGQETSLEKCLKGCKNGRCVEMGPGSATICFPHVPEGHKVHNYLTPCSRRWPADFI